MSAPKSTNTGEGRHRPSSLGTQEAAGRQDGATAPETERHTERHTRAGMSTEKRRDPRSAARQPENASKTPLLWQQEEGRQLAKEKSTDNLWQQEVDA